MSSNFNQCRKGKQQKVKQVNTQQNKTGNRRKRQVYAVKTLHQS